MSCKIPVSLNSLLKDDTLVLSINCSVQVENDSFCFTSILSVDTLCTRNLEFLEHQHLVSLAIDQLKGIRIRVLSITTNHYSMH